MDTDESSCTESELEEGLYFTLLDCIEVYVIVMCFTVLYCIVLYCIALRECGSTLYVGLAHAAPTPLNT